MNCLDKDDAIVAEAGKRAEREVAYFSTSDDLPTETEAMVLVCAIADKRGRALREAMAQHAKDEECDICICGHVWPCPSLARIREILGGE